MRATGIDERVGEDGIRACAGLSAVCNRDQVEDLPSEPLAPAFLRIVLRFFGAAAAGSGTEAFVAAFFLRAATRGDSLPPASRWCW